MPNLPVRSHVDCRLLAAWPADTYDSDYVIEIGNASASLGVFVTCSRCHLRRLEECLAWRVLRAARCRKQRDFKRQDCCKPTGMFFGKFLFANNAVSITEFLTPGRLIESP